MTAGWGPLPRGGANTVYAWAEPELVRAGPPSGPPNIRRSFYENRRFLTRRESDLGLQVAVPARPGARLPMTCQAAAVPTAPALPKLAMYVM